MSNSSVGIWGTGQKVWVFRYLSLILSLWRNKSRKRVKYANNRKKGRLFGNVEHHATIMREPIGLSYQRISQRDSYMIYPNVLKPRWIREIEVQSNFAANISSVCVIVCAHTKLVNLIGVRSILFFSRRPKAK